MKLILSLCLLLIACDMGEPAMPSSGPVWEPAKEAIVESDDSTDASVDASDATVTD